MKQIRDFRGTIPKEVLDLHPIEFAHLIGTNSMYPFDDGKPPSNKEDNAFIMAVGYNP